jgi:hypothetical protein
MYAANSHVIRPATPTDEHALRRIAKQAGRRALDGRIMVAEVRGAVAAAMSRDDHRAIADTAIAPAYLTTLLRLRIEGMDAFEREPDLSVRLAEALQPRRPAEDLPLAA